MDHLDEVLQARHSRRRGHCRRSPPWTLGGPVRDSTGVSPLQDRDETDVGSGQKYRLTATTLGYLRSPVGPRWGVLGTTPD